MKKFKRFEVTFSDGVNEYKGSVSATSIDDGIREWEETWPEDEIVKIEEV